MRYATVCSGIGCPEVAWSRLGWEHAFVSEIDPFASAVLAHRLPSVPNLGDLTKIGADHGPVDLLCGGTPCQSFSVAGRRAGLDDPRGVLAFEFLRLADRLRARWLVFENVPGFLSIDGGRAFGAFAGGLAKLGYGWAMRVLDAQWFGVAQRRARVFVVAHLGDWRGPVAVLLEPEGLRGDPAPGREEGEGLAPTLANRARGGGGLGTDAECDGALIVPLQEVSCSREKKQNGAGIGESGDPCYTLEAGHQHGIAEIAHTLKSEGADASEDGTGRGVPLVVAENQRGELRLAEQAMALGQGGGKPGSGYGALLAATLTQGAESQGKGGYAGRRREDDQNLVVGFHARQDPIHGDKSMPLEAKGGQAVMARSAVRRFTPRECERLQGLPDDWTLVPYRGKPAKDGPRYRAIGNGMAVPVIRWIGERIAMFEEIRA